ncbi:hypothetical protein HJA87_21080 [Rhizobium bangladeshense]|uniref:Uncharacterized protein n=1 Tax=Rhizobium bangladeshense TaxID=1138189 RepID=A0ABS7LLJ3_9HYPH|nr:hypothetical protein [Rhizobium bangladeshense]MBY3592349.1 hypothetical protein [Rhizobium bangladeshense]
MTKNPLTPIMRIHIRLATGAREATIDESLIAEARELGLTGAEIDAAMRGASFNAVTDVAVKYALAVREGNDVAADAAKKKLIAFTTMDVSRQIKEMLSAPI